MSDPDVCAASNTLRNGNGNCCRLRSKGGQKLKRGHFNRWWFQRQETGVLLQAMARAVTGLGERFMKSLELAVDKYCRQIFFAPEVVIESALRRVYCRGDPVNARLNIADVLKQFAGSAQKHLARIVLSMRRLPLNRRHSLNSGRQSPVRGLSKKTEFVDS